MTVLQFIQKNISHANRTAVRYGVPSIVTLAQAAWESGWGTHAPKYNFFGMTAGSNYNGMLVMPILSPEQFAVRVAVPFAHPHARNVQITEAKPLNDLANKYSQLSAQMIPGNAFNYSAAIVTLQYIENTISYDEKIVCIIEDYGEMSAGMWGNKETWYVRAEKGKFESTFIKLGIPQSVVVSAKL